MASKGYGITQQDMVCKLALWTAATPCCLRGNGLVDRVAFAAGRIKISICLGAEREASKVSLMDC